MQTSGFCWIAGSKIALVRACAMLFFTLAMMAGVDKVGAQVIDPAYPSRPIKLIIPNAAGSSVDTMGRLLAGQLGALLGQSVFVDNRAGAAGAIGMDIGKTAAPDGYTFIVTSASAMTVAPLLQKSISYDPLKDFYFVSLVAVLPNVLVANPALKLHTVADLVAYSKAHPGQVNMASAGPGAVSHLAGVLLTTSAGFESLHVPYKGGSQSVASVVSGETQWTLTPAPAAMALVKAGRLTALGHSLSQGAKALDGIPVIAETMAGFEYSGWVGVVAPRGVPAPMAEKLRRAIILALQQSGLQDALQSNGAVGMTSTPDEFRAYLRRDIEKTRSAIRAAGLKPE